MPAFRMNSLRDTYGAGQQMAMAEQQNALNNALAMRQENRLEQKEQRSEEQASLARLGQLASPLVTAYQDVLDAGGSESDAKAAVAPYYAKAGELAMRLGLADEWDPEFDINEATSAAQFDPDFAKVWATRVKTKNDQAVENDAEKEAWNRQQNVNASVLEQAGVDPTSPEGLSIITATGGAGKPDDIGIGAKAWMERQKDKPYNIPNDIESFFLEQPHLDLTTEAGKKKAMEWFRGPEGRAAWQADKARRKADAIEIAGAKTAAGEAAREPSRVRDDEIGMAKEYEAASKPFMTAKYLFEPSAKYAKGVETGRTSPSPAQDRDFVISYLKMIHPSQAPEKWGMMNIDALPPLPIKVLRGIKNLFAGKELDPQTRSEMALAMHARFEVYNEEQGRLEESTLRRAQNYGFKPENVVPRRHAVRAGEKKPEAGSDSGWSIKRVK